MAVVFGLIRPAVSLDDSQSEIQTHFEMIKATSKIAHKETEDE